MTMFDDFHDDFADQDLSKLTKASKTAIAEINKYIAANSDPRTKTVGDRIIIWDSSRLSYENGEHVTDFREERLISRTPSIVIEDRQRFEAKLETLGGDFTKVLDLKVWNENLNKIYRTSSEFVRLV